MVWRFHSNRTDFGMYTHSEVNRITANHMEMLGVCVRIPGMIPHPATGSVHAASTSGAIASLRTDLKNHSTGSGCSSMINPPWLFSATETYSSIVSTSPSPSAQMGRNPCQHSQILWGVYMGLVQPPRHHTHPLPQEHEVPLLRNVQLHVQQWRSLCGPPSHGTHHLPAEPVRTLLPRHARIQNSRLHSVRCGNRRRQHRGLNPSPTPLRARRLSSPIHDRPPTRCRPLDPGKMQYVEKNLCRCPQHCNS